MNERTTSTAFLYILISGGVSLHFGRLKNRETLIFASCVLSVVCVYWLDLLVLLDDALKNEMASYILALPFMVTYVTYRKRNLLRAQLSLEVENSQGTALKDLLGVAICSSALFLHVYGSFTFNVVEYHIASLAAFVVGCSVFLLGMRNLRNMISPLVFLLLLIVPYREEAYQAGSQLSALTSTITFTLLDLLGYPVSLSSLYDAPAIMVETSSGEAVPFVIDIPCSGVYSLVGFLVFALFFAFISRGGALRKGVWLILGFSLMYAANIFRVSSILAAGYWFGLETATELFHLFSGSMVILVASILMISVGEKYLGLRLFKRKEATRKPCPLCRGGNRTGNESFCSFCGESSDSTSFTLSAADLGKIIAFSFLLAILTNVQVPTFALAQERSLELDIHETTGSSGIRRFLPAFEGYEPEFVYRDQRFERMSQQDASLLYIYSSKNSTGAPVFASIEIADSFSKLHRWEICLHAVPVEQGRQIVNPIVSKDTQILENPPLAGRTFVFMYIESRQTVMILYWYEKVALKIEGSWTSRYVKTSMMVYLDSFVKTGEIGAVNEYAQLDSKLVSMAQNIIEYWEPVKEWSAYMVVFAQHGRTLSMAIIISASFLVALLHFKNERDAKNQAESTYRQLVWYSTFSEKEKQILRVLEMIDEKEGITGTELSKTYEDKTGNRIEPEELAEIMRFAEEYGLIRKGIKSKDGKPVLLWRRSVYLGI